MKKNPKIGGAINVPHNALSSNQMSISRSGLELTHLMHNKTQVKPSKGQVMKGTNHASILMGIRKYRTLMRDRSKIGSSRRSSRLGREHIVLNQKIMSILGLT